MRSEASPGQNQDNMGYDFYELLSPMFILLFIAIGEPDYD